MRQFEVVDLAAGNGCIGFSEDISVVLSWSGRASMPPNPPALCGSVWVCLSFSSIGTNLYRAYHPLQEDPLS